MTGRMNDPRIILAERALIVLHAEILPIYVP